MKNFTQKFAELEKITEQLESGDLDLEKSMVLFEKGIKLAEELKKKLKEAENRITKIPSSAVAATQRRAKKHEEH